MKEYRGIMLPADEEHMQRYIDISPFAQAALLKHAMPFCKQRRRFIDVGGAIGLWAISAIKDWDFEHVDTFEPNKFQREALKANLVKYEVQDKVTVHSEALLQGKTTKPTYMAHQPGNVGTSFITKEAAEGFEVSSTALDNFDFEDVDFLKIDTEGTETHVIGGALELLRRCSPVVCLEDKGHSVRYGIEKGFVIKYLEYLGYKVLVQAGSDFILGRA